MKTRIQRKAFPSPNTGKGLGLVNSTLGWKKTEPKDHLVNKQVVPCADRVPPESPELLPAVAKVSLDNLPLEDQWGAGLALAEPGWRSARARPRLPSPEHRPQFGTVTEMLRVLAAPDCAPGARPPGAFCKVHVNIAPRRLHSGPAGAAVPGEPPRKTAAALLPWPPRCLPAPCPS